MRLFACLIDRYGAPVSEGSRQQYELAAKRLRLQTCWHVRGPVAALVAQDEAGGSPMIVERNGDLAVGLVRLDNAPDLRRWVGRNGPESSDLELVLDVVTQFGQKYVPQVLGDFAFVVWNAAALTAVAASDAFAVRGLYYTERGSLTAFSSRADILAFENCYDVHYLAEKASLCLPSVGRTVYAGVARVPGGFLAVLQSGTLKIRQYWSAYDFEPEPVSKLPDGAAAEACRALFADSVRLRLMNDGVWSHLSGGIDSSSIVSMAQWLVRRGDVPQGLEGTITWADSHGTGADERHYADAVVSQWQIRNEVIIDPPVWQDDAYPRPLLDGPSMALVQYPRESRLCSVVRSAGGKVLLTGTAGDVLFSGNMFFFADWVSRGRVGPALYEMSRRAAIGRVSFWELAYRNAVLPLLPQSLQRRLVRDDGEMPPWVSKKLVRRYGLDRRCFVPSIYAGRTGRKYYDARAATVAAIGPTRTQGVTEDSLEIRHPFLYRPLVEFALQLPPELCVRPHARKWVLREAMRGILPDLVRTRIGKGSVYGLLSWSLSRQRALLEPLVDDPILAELGVVDRSKLRASFVAAQQERDNRQRLASALTEVLAVEAWLQLRSGRWPRGVTAA